MIPILFLILVPVCMLLCRLIPAGAVSVEPSRFIRREGQAVCVAAMLIVMSSLVEHYVPEKADDLLILGGIFAPVVVAAVAGRRFLWYGFFTVAAGVLFRILADHKFQLSAFANGDELLSRYGFSAVVLCGFALGTCTYLKQYASQERPA